MKYNPCCGRRCCIARCGIRDRGGCYCVCRIYDHINDLKNLIDGTSCGFNGGFIYKPDRVPIPLQGKELEETLAKLQQAEKKLSKYEMKGNVKDEIPNDKEESCKHTKT